MEELAWQAAILSRGKRMMETRHLLKQIIEIIIAVLQLILLFL
ncbi:hypothetical protein [Enterobacter kobei]